MSSNDVMLDVLVNNSTCKDKGNSHNHDYYTLYVLYNFWQRF